MIFSIMGMGLLLRSLTQFALLILSSQFFRPLEIGAAAVFFAIYHLIWPWFEVAITQTYIQIDEHKNLQFETLRMLSNLAGVVAIVAAVCLYFVFEAMAPGWGVTVSALIIVTIALRSQSVFAHSDLLKRLQIKEHALIEQGSYVGGFSLALIFCVYFQVGILYLVLGIFLNSLISCVLFLKVNNVQFTPRIHKGSLRDVLNISTGFFVGSGLNTFVREANVLFIGALISTSAAAYYNRGIQLYMLGAFTIGQVFDRLLTPIFKRNLRKKESSVAMFELATLVLFACFIPASVFLFVNAGTLVLVLFGDDWEGVEIILKVLAIVLSLRTVMKINEATLRAFGYAWKRVLLYIVWCSVLMLGALPASKFGLIGFATTEAVGVISFWLFSSIISCKLVSSPWRFQMISVCTAIPSVLIFMGLHYNLVRLGGLNVHWVLVLEILAIMILAVLQIISVTKLRFGSLSVLRQFR